MLLADYQSYVDCQDAVSQAYTNQEAWTRMSILNVARDWQILVRPLDSGLLCRHLENMAGDYRDIAESISIRVALHHRTPLFVSC